MVLASVIIVSHNSIVFLEECIRALYKQSFKDFEIILVDNDSKDGSADFVENKFKKVKVIRNDKNLGLCTANNIGVKYSKGKYLAFLNPDTVVERNWLKELVKNIKDERVGSAQSMILLYDKKDRINTKGMFFNYLCFGWSGGYMEKYEKQENPSKITFPSGASFMMRREVFDQIEGFDDDIFLYYEDSDIGWRLRLLGYENILVPKSIVYHKYAFSRNKDKFYYMERNRLRLFLRNYAAKSIFLTLPIFLITEVGIIFYSISSGWFKGKMKTYSYIFKNYSKIMKKRKTIQRTRKIPDSEIVKYFEDDINFIEVNNFISDNILNPFLRFYWKLIKRLL